MNSYQKTDRVPVVSDDDPELTAYHEAGHVLMAVHVGARVESVSIAPDWDDGPKRHGDTAIAWPGGRMTEREFAEKSVCVALAGPVAEMIYRQEPLHPGFVAEWAADWQDAWQAASPLIVDERRRLDFLEKTTIEVQQLFDQDEYWAALAAIADELLAHERLDGDLIDDVVGIWLPG